jgi:hypothetical protein
MECYVAVCLVAMTCLFAWFAVEYLMFGASAMAAVMTAFGLFSAGAVIVEARVALSTLRWRGVHERGLVDHRRGQVVAWREIMSVAPRWRMHGLRLTLVDGRTVSIAVLYFRDSNRIHREILRHCRANGARIIGRLRDADLS